MTKLIEESRINYSSFKTEWSSDISDKITALEAHTDKYEKSYLKVSSVQAWRDIISDTLGSESIQFYDEAQNDLLTSHIFAQVGFWRSSLKALRSGLENVLQCLYYKDHPIEYLMWEEGRHRLSFSELILYFEQHPTIKKRSKDLINLEGIKRELYTLSRAVHGSAPSFRMTRPGNFPIIATDDPASVGMWATRESCTISAINSILLGLYAEKMDGSRFLNQRKIIAVNLTQKQKRAAKALSVNLDFSI